MLVVTVMAAGIIAAAGLGGTGDAQTWSRWANVGEAFGILDTVLSGLAFVALIVTLWIQLNELRLQQSELRLQRDAIQRSSDELRRSAEAGMRMLHFELMRMSIDDPALAEVWPRPDVSDPGERRQLFYANLIYQHLLLWMESQDYSDAQVRDAVRHLFSSPLMRRYWTVAAAERARLSATSADEARITRIVNEVCHEFDRAAEAV
jgi:hypothetical protein